MKLVRIMALIIMFACIIAVAGKTHAEELNVRQPSQNEIGTPATCPVTKEGFKVSKETPVIDYKGKSYFFCCEGCTGDFKKDPEKYSSALELKVREPKDSELGKSVTCPVSKEGFEVSKNTPVIDYKGKSYFFCCDGCIGDFKKDPEKFAK